MLPTAAAFEHPERGRSSGPTTYFEGLGRDGHACCRCSTGATPRTTRTSPAVRVGQVRLPRRRLAAAPALGAEGQRAVRRRSLARLPRRRGDGGVGRGRDGAGRPDGRSARRRVHRRARARSADVAIFPYHGTRGRPPPRAVGRPAPGDARCSSASTSRPRSASRGWTAVGAGQVSVYDRDGTRVVQRGGRAGPAADAFLSLGRQGSPRTRPARRVRANLSSYGATVVRRRRRVVTLA